jgi:membrane-associated protease RseP (regulator of RpoE activity)
LEGEEEFKKVKFTYGIIMLKTKRGLSLLDKFGSFRISKPLGWFMLYLMPISGAVALFLILNLVALYLSPQGAAAVAYIRTISPLGNLLIPGINPYVPWFYGWIALVTAVFIHEASHGIIARSLGLPVKAAGVLFLLFIPIGAFVEIDDKLLKSARGRDTGRVLAAGSGINIILALASLALLILSISTMVPAVQGAGIIGVNPNTPELYSAADVSGIRPGDFIIAINNQPVTDLSRFFGDSGVFKPGQSISITVWRAGQIIQKQNVTLGQLTILDIRTNKTYSIAFLGVNQISYQGLQSSVSSYTTQYTRNPVAYIVLPTLPLPNQRVNVGIPFSDPMVGFYRSSLGAALPFATNLLFWLWFININLAIFNSLPIYPMDGGQAFETALRSLGRGRISDEIAKRITLSLTIVLVTVLVAAITGPYLSSYLPA